MANEQNLIPQSKRTKTEQREIARLGEKKSGASRRKKKYMKEQLETLMLLNLNEGKLKDNMRKLGIKEDELTIQNGILCSLVQQALHGSIRAFQVIRDQLGQNPKDGEAKEHIENIIFINDIPSKLKEK